MPRGRPRNQPIDESTEVSADEMTLSDEVSSDEDSKESWDVMNKYGVYIRTYTLEVHGSNASGLALQFAQKIGGSVK